MKQTEGLYVTLLPNGRIKRALIPREGEVLLASTTVAEEIILFSELNLGAHAMLVDMIREKYADEGESFASESIAEAGFADAMISAINFLGPFEKDYILVGYLTKFMLEDAVEEDSPASPAGTSAVVIDRLTITMRLQFLVNEALYDLSTHMPLDLQEKFSFFRQAEYTQILTLNNKLTSWYRFRSITEYIRFLMMHLLSSDSNVARCECCGRYFIPKTRKKTLYCDRVLWNGKTCKEYAPILKHKQDVQNNAVLEAFDRAKQRMYKRYERAENSAESLPKGITYSEYYEWLDAATEARDQFLQGSISQEDALKIIEIE